MKKIVIKEIDKLYSKLHADRFIVEYIVYLMDNDIAIETYTEFGYLAMKIRVNELMLVHSINNNELIQEVNFEELIKNQN